RIRKRFAAHDEIGEAKAGDLVRIQESRPYSATKRWKIAEVLSRAGEAGAAAPRAAEIEKMLEEAEGVTEILAPEREEKEERAELHEDRLARAGGALMASGLRLRKGDEVVVIAGKDRGKRGRVQEVHPRERTVIVAGVNISKRHTKPNPTKNQKGGIVEQPRP